MTSMSTNDKDYDQRQLELMQLQLDQFEAGTINLSHLITGLNALLASVQTLGKDWKEAFKSDWWTLEQVHAVALDRKKTALSSEDHLLIKEAISHLRTLIASPR
jgi:hypothetical protein